MNSMYFIYLITSGSAEMKSIATGSPRDRRIGVGNLLLHPLARVISNRSFKKLREEEGNLIINSNIENEDV